MSINKSDMQYKIDDIPDKPLQNMQILNELSDNIEKDKKLPRPISNTIQNDILKSKKVEKKMDKEIKNLTKSAIISEYRQSLDGKPREDKRFSEILLKSQEKFNLNDVNHHIHSQSIPTGSMTTRGGTKNPSDDLKRIYDTNGLSPNYSSYQTLLTKNPSHNIKERVSSAS